MQNINRSRGEGQERRESLGEDDLEGLQQKKGGLELGEKDLKDYGQKRASLTGYDARSRKARKVEEIKSRRGMV